MVAVLKQVAIGGLDTEADEVAEIEATRVWRAELWSAMRMFVETYIDSSGLKKYDGCAHRLNKIREDEGRPVTAGALKNALAADPASANRNNFRLEWAYWFAARCPDIAALLARHVRPKKTGDERAADIEAEVRETLSHKEAEKLFRRARAR